MLYSSFKSSEGRPTKARGGVGVVVAVVGVLARGECSQAFTAVVSSSCPSKGVSVCPSKGRPALPGKGVPVVELVVLVFRPPLWLSPPPFRPAKWCVPPLQVCSAVGSTGRGGRTDEGKPSPDSAGIGTPGTVGTSLWCPGAGVGSRALVKAPASPASRAAAGAGSGARSPKFLQPGYCCWIWLHQRLFFDGFAIYKDGRAMQCQFSSCEQNNTAAGTSDG